ncbi:MAG: hypothetical protein AYK19_07365 [Theionarchaea archaeon DG-70-1]|nr:MAG: hypothetical protein AYK19_07365 [Theionarchaea archaeon DG-70-1]
MKSSLYNMIVPCKKENKKEKENEKRNGNKNKRRYKNEKRFAVFNTLHGSLLFVDEELKSILEAETFDLLDEETLTTLKRLGIVIDDLDEKKFLSFHMKSLIYASRSASFSVLPTYACNLACPYCYEGCGELHRSTMSTEMVTQVIQGIRAYCLDNGICNLGLTLYGGEPLLHKKASLNLVTTLGKWAGPEGIAYKCNMITNGTLITEQILSEFEPYLKMVQLTVDGPQLYHDKKRVQKNGEGTYETIMGAVNTARDCHIKVMIRIQVAQDNIHEIDTLFQDLAERGFNKDENIHAYVFPLMSINDVCSSYASLCSEEDAQLLPQLWRTAREYGFDMVSKPVQIFRSPYCSFAALHSFLVDALGDVYTCVSVVGDQKYRVARITEKGLKDITPELYAFTVRDPTEIRKCQNCVVLPLCGGGCAHRAYQKYGSYQAGDCTLHKGLEEEKLVLYLEKMYPDRMG